MINRVKVRGRVGVTRIIIAVFTLGISLPFLGVRKAA